MKTKAISTDVNHSFVETFSLQNRKVYIAGESYAGMYVPYISSHFLDLNDTKNYDVKGIMIYDPSKANSDRSCIQDLVANDR